MSDGATHEARREGGGEEDECDDARAGLQKQVSLWAAMGTGGGTAVVAGWLSPSPIEILSGLMGRYG